MAESRHSQGGDAANVEGAAGAGGHVDLEPFEGELGDVEASPYALDPEEIAEHYNRGAIEREQRRQRRQRMETYRARVILAGGALFVVLMVLQHPAAAFGILLAVVLAAIALRRRGR